MYGEPTLENEEKSLDIEPEKDEVKVTISNYPSATEPSNEYPVAIVGACEYIFSKNYGVLGDVIAGKGQAFGTLTVR